MQHRGPQRERREYDDDPTVQVRHLSIYVPLIRGIMTRTTSYQQDNFLAPMPSDCRNPTPHVVGE